jgi:3-deoxy-D-manno-octulosonate 8-phosphate phosphatase (KDO 8-P phosphatase)
VISDEELVRRAARLEWLLLDVDGVFTDGSLLYSERGEELKSFHVRDGLGVKLAQRAGLKVGVLSGRTSRALARRARDLALDATILDRSAKGTAFERFCGEQGTTPERVAYVGDDLLDLPVLARCGLSFAPADAVAEVRERVHRVLAARGGSGAVRELVELVLRARGDWQRVAAPYLAGGGPGLAS